MMIMYDDNAQNSDDNNDADADDEDGNEVEVENDKLQCRKMRT